MLTVTPGIDSRRSPAVGIRVLSSTAPQHAGEVRHALRTPSADDQAFTPSDPSRIFVFIDRARERTKILPSTTESTRESRVGHSIRGGHWTGVEGGLFGGAERATSILLVTDGVRSGIVVEEFTAC